MANSTQLNKTATQIFGLDKITLDGLPQGRCTLLAGGPSIFVAFEEDATRIVTNTATCGDYA